MGGAKGPQHEPDNIRFTTKKHGDPAIFGTNSVHPRTPRLIERRPRILPTEAKVGECTKHFYS